MSSPSGACPKRASDYAEIHRMLAGAELFADLDGAALRALSAHLLAREYAAGEAVFREGDPGDWMAILVSGEIRICKEGDVREARDRPAVAIAVLLRIARLVSRRLRMSGGGLVDRLDS